MRTVRNPDFFSRVKLVELPQTMTMEVLWSGAAKVGTSNVHVLCVCMYVYVCMYVFVCILVYVRMYICMCVCVCMNFSICKNVCIYVCTVCTYACMYECMYDLVSKTLCYCMYVFLCDF